jgi:hypothetical protein
MPALSALSKQRVDACGARYATGGVEHHCKLEYSGFETAAYNI